MAVGPAPSWASLSCRTHVRGGYPTHRLTVDSGLATTRLTGPRKRVTGSIGIAQCLPGIGLNGSIVTGIRSVDTCQVPLSTISGGIGNVVTIVGRCSLDLNVAPGRILSGEPQNGSTMT